MTRCKPDPEILLNITIEIDLDLDLNQNTAVTDRATISRKIKIFATFITNTVTPLTDVINPVLLRRITTITILNRKTLNQKIRIRKTSYAALPRGDRDCGGIKTTFFFDRKSGFNFLVDTGSDISLDPVEAKAKLQPADFVIYAANNSHINTFGERRLSIDLGLRRSISWNFCIAGIPYPIIDADLLSSFGLNVGLRKRRIVDSFTECQTIGRIRKVSLFGISSIDRSSSFSKVLSGFPGLTGLTQSSEILASKVAYHIVTSGPPVAERARKLAPDKYAVARSWFGEMEKSGRCRPSSSAWAFPLHMEGRTMAELTLVLFRTDILFRICRIFQIFFLEKPSSPSWIFLWPTTRSLLLRRIFLRPRS